VNARVQDGPRHKATTLALNTDYRILLQKLNDLWRFIREITGMPIRMLADSRAYNLVRKRRELFQQ
jgi:hypothetical protein